MPEHYKSPSMISTSRRVRVSPSLWLRGEESNKLSLIYDKNSNKFDIFGWMLLKSGYASSQFSGFRVPSQFAQTINSSGRLLEGVASLLTTTTHVDTDFTVKIGKINDDPSLDIFQCELALLKEFHLFNVGLDFEEILPFKGWSNVPQVIVDALDMFKNQRTPITSQYTTLCDNLSRDGYTAYYYSLGDNNKYAFALYNSITNVLIADVINYQPLVLLAGSSLIVSDTFNQFILNKLQLNPELASEELRKLLDLNKFLILPPASEPEVEEDSTLEDDEDDYPDVCDCGDCRISRGEQEDI